MSRWETTSTLETAAPPAAIWDNAYAQADDWLKWNPELKRATLEGPLREGAEARIVFRAGLRLRFLVTELEDGRIFTDEARLPGADRPPAPDRARGRWRQPPDQHDLH